MSQFTLIATTRSDTGKGASRRLRRSVDQVPAIIYGGKKDPTLLQLPHNKVLKALESEAFYSSILDVEIDGKAEKAVLKALQRHPAKSRIMHMDFLRVSETDELTMRIPLHFIHEDLSPGVKAGGMVSRLMNDIEISCLPKHLPEYIEIDLSNVELDHHVHVSDIAFPEGVVWAGDMEKAAETGVVYIHILREVPEETEAEQAAAAEAKEGEAAAGEAGSTPESE